MKKILIGICGIGNGHINRQACVINELLKEKAKIVVATQEEKIKILKERFPTLNIIKINIPWITCNDSGIDINSTLNKYKEDKTTAEVGIKATSRIELDNALIIPQVSFAVAKDFGTSNPEIKAQFVGGGDKFVTPSRKPDDMIYKVGAGVEARITNDTKIRFDLNYDRSKDGDFEGYSGNVTLGISF